MLSDVLYRLRALLRRGAVEAELDAELRFHVEREAEKYIRQGMTPEQARRRARLASGGPDQVREMCRDARGTRWLEDAARDLRYGFRVLRKSPGFAAAAAATMALGIGAATAMFSVVDAVVLRPLPYRNAARLVLVDPMLSNAAFYDLRSRTAAAFEDMTTVMVYRAVVPHEDGTAERISKGLVNTNFLRMLGGRVALGRDFEEADGRPPATPDPPFPPPVGRVAILSHEYFERRYGGNPAVVGSRMLGSQGPGPLIVGVLEPGFRLLLPARFSPDPAPDLWVANDRGYDAEHRGDLMLRAIGTMREGVDIGRARAAIAAATSEWRLPDFRVSAALWHENLVAEVRPDLLALMGAVVFLLLIACANVANLLLVRASLREREWGTRAALGARAGWLARQVLAEALVLAGLGTVAGVGLAWLGVRELLALVPPNVPRVDSAAIDWRVLAFAAITGLVEAALFGAVPAWRAARGNVLDILRGGRTAGLAAGGWLRSTVAVAEVALAFVLLIGSGLMFRSFLELRRVHPGFDAHGLLTFLAVGDARGFQQPARRLAFLRDVRDRLQAIPGVLEVGGSPSLPLAAGFPSFGGLEWGTGPAPTAAGATHRADLRYTLPGYFEVLRTRLIEGRTFTEADNQPGRNLAVIDEILARQAFPQGSPTGKRIYVKMPDPTPLEVIGVVQHQRLGALAAPGLPQIWVTDGYWGIGISRNWMLRTAGDPGKYAAAVRAEIAKVLPGRMAVTQLQSMDAVVDRAQEATRFQLLLIGVFASVAALLAEVGLYGVLASLVRQRTAEIGVRMALGAAPGAIFALVIGHGLRLSAAGVAIGLAAALGLTGAMRGMLVGVRSTDPATFAAMAVLFLTIAAVASWLPARRAARLDPAAALREE